MADDFMAKILGPGPINVSASTLTSDMHVDDIKKLKDDVYELNTRLIDKKHSTATMRREKLVLDNGNFRKWPRGKAWEDLRGGLGRRAYAYIKEHAL